jgi:hypothetical protein
MRNVSLDADALVPIIASANSRAPYRLASKNENYTLSFALLALCENTYFIENVDERKYLFAGLLNAPTRYKPTHSQSKITIPVIDISHHQPLSACFSLVINI